MPQLDTFLPTAPARVRVLVLPVGPIHRDRFAAFFERLRGEYAVHLRDVSTDGRPNRNMFNPLAFPDGVLFYDLTTNVPSPAHLALSPFDLFREPLVVLALADSEAIKTVPFGDALKRHSAASAGRSVEERNVRALDQELEALRDTYPRALVHRVLLFDYALPPKNSADTPVPIPEGLATIPPLAQSKRTTMKTVMADITSLLLAEMTTLARSLEALPFIESPGQSSSSEPGDTVAAAAASSPARRNSQFVLPTHRSSSASGGDRAQARMSMPVPFKGHTAAGPTPRRPSTPVRSGTVSGAAPTFDDIVGGAGGAGGAGGSSTMSSPDRTGSPFDSASTISAATSAKTGDSHRSQSQDRIALQGFGAGGLNERWRHKGKSRIAIVVASLYLQAGRWTDALKELVDGATVARSINDHLWHGKALELIVVCLLLLAWADMEFQVPTVCLPPPEKGSAAALLAAAQLEAAAAAAASAAATETTASPTQPRWLRHLQQILPDLLERILGLYARLSSERLPALPLAETTIRFGNLLAALHMADGVLGRRMLDMVVEGKYATDASPSSLLSFSPRLSVVPSRTHITNLLFRAFPSSAAEMPATADRVVLLSGIAAALGRLGSRRKKAMVVRELISVLVGGLVEARTRGAAEVGIHPAAGLMSAQAAGGGSGANGAAMLDLAEGDIEAGLDAFLGMLLRTYGVVEFDPAAAAAAAATTVEAASDDSDAAVVARIRAQAAARMFGMPGAKLSLLRACIHFSEALPDFSGVLRYSSDLLRTAGSGIAPGGHQGDAAPSIGRDEQVQLVTNIAKTSDLARRLGFGASVAAEYWDEFLLRGVKLEPPPEAHQPVAHAKSELLPRLSGNGYGPRTGAVAAVAVRASQDVDPFIHNSFLKASDAAVVEQILVAQEPATFKLTLQNPYDIEVEIESIRLETKMEAAEVEGDEGGGNSAFEAFAESAVLGPYRTQIVRVVGQPRAAGALLITGAVVRVRGCRERRFPLFVQPWWPARDEKVKRIGVAPFEVVAPAVSTAQATSAPPPRGSPPLQPERVALTVIPPQPLVVVRASTLAQSAVMLLEGERRVFSVTLENVSATTAVDFLVFSFRDSTQASVQAALTNRDASPTELYEYELMLARKQALRLRGGGGGQGSGTDDAATQESRYRRCIAPGQTATYEFEILGKPGLTSGTIQVDYAHLGVPLDAVAAKFYTRQVSLFLTVTVNASVEVARMDVLPLHGPIPGALWDRCGGGAGELREDESPTDGPEGPDGDSPDGPDGDEAERDKYCLLQLDLRNAWPSQMRVELTGAGGQTVVRARILPGNTRRVLVPLRRIYLEDPHASIPVLNPARQRQFVVSTGKISPDMERATREAFWYREAILKALQGTWATVGDDDAGDAGNGGDDDDDDDDDAIPQRRHGHIELRGMRLTARMIEALKVDEVGIDVAVEAAGAPGKAVSVVAVDTFVQVRVRIANRTAQPLFPTLRLLPALCHRPGPVALDYTRKFGWNGTLQQALPALAAHATTEVRLGAVALCRGEFAVTASVEETRLWEAPAAPKAETSTSGRPRSNTETLLLDTMLGPRERRIWHSRQPCRFLVVEG